MKMGTHAGVTLRELHEQRGKVMVVKNERERERERERARNVPKT